MGADVSGDKKGRRRRIIQKRNKGHTEEGIQTERSWGHGALFIVCLEADIKLGCPKLKDWCSASEMLLSLVSPSF